MSSEKHKNFGFKVFSSSTIGCAVSAAVAGHEPPNRRLLLRKQRGDSAPHELGQIQSLLIRRSGCEYYNTTNS